MKCYFRKSLSGLEPADDAAETMMRKLSVGAWVSADIKQPRNIDHHRKFFALLNLIYRNQEHYKSVDEVLDAFKFSIGHYDTQRFKVAGAIYEHHRPRSISFAKMDQSEFDVFYNKAVDFMVTDIIPGLDRADLERELTEFAR